MDTEEYNGVMRAAVGAMHHAISTEDEAVTGLLGYIAGPGDDTGHWPRLAAAIYTWLQMCRGAAHLIDADLRAVIDTGSEELPAEVGAAVHIYNLGINADWNSAGEVFGAAIAADIGYETVAQVLAIAANLLRRLQLSPRPHDH